MQRARQNRRVPGIANYRNPGGAIVECVQIESHMEVYKWRDAIFRDPCTMTRRQEDPLLDQRAAARPSTPSRVGREAQAFAAEIERVDLVLDERAGRHGRDRNRMLAVASAATVTARNHNAMARRWYHGAVATPFRKRRVRRFTITDPANQSLFWVRGPCHRFAQGLGYIRVRSERKYSSAVFFASSKPDGWPVAEPFGTPQSRCQGVGPTRTKEPPAKPQPS
jgi:hypothetical protein